MPEIDTILRIINVLAYFHLSFQVLTACFAMCIGFYHFDKWTLHHLLKTSERHYRQGICGALLAWIGWVTLLMAITAITGFQPWMLPVVGSWILTGIIFSAAAVVARGTFARS